MNPGLKSKIIYVFLKGSKIKYLIERKASKNNIKRSKKFPPNHIKRLYLTHFDSYNNSEFVSFEHKKQVTKKHLIFFHGGAYLFEASARHWKLAESIVNKNFCRMTLVDYPLAPEYNYKNTFDSINGIYEKLVEYYPNDQFIFIGDSAGGGLALAFAQKLIAEKHFKLPEKLVLLSPWLDLTLSNQEIKSQEKKDYILTIRMLHIAAEKYSDGADKKTYLLSPIYGDLNNLPQTIIFYGTEELFYPDIEKLKSLSNYENKNIIFKEYFKMQHDWSLFPIPESKKVVKEICEFINYNG